MITCQEVVEYLMAYLGGELAPDESSAFERHLKVCPQCVSFLENYKVTVQLGQLAYANHAVDEESIPDFLVQAILAAKQLRKS